MSDSQFLNDLESSASDEKITDAEVTPAADKESGGSKEQQSTGEKEGATPDAKENDAIRGLREAKVAETRKRQELERQLAEVKERIAVQESQRVAQKNAPAKELSDEEIYNDIPGAIKRLKNEYSQALHEQRYTMSVDVAKKFHDDYDEVITHFNDMTKQQPYLMQSVDAAASPALAAYEIAKRDISQKKLQDPKELEAKIQAEVSKRVKEALEGKARSIAANVPPSFSSGSSSASDEDMDDIFKLAGKRKY